MSKRERYEVCSAAELGSGEVAASQLHSPAQCLHLGVVGRGDHNQVPDLPLELVHHNVLGIVGPLGVGEIGWHYVMLACTKKYKKKLNFFFFWKPV